MNYFTLQSSPLIEPVQPFFKGNIPSAQFLDLPPGTALRSQVSINTSYAGGVHLSVPCKDFVVATKTVSHTDFASGVDQLEYQQLLLNLELWIPPSYTHLRGPDQSALVYNFQPVKRPTYKNSLGYKFTLSEEDFPELQKCTIV